MLLDFSGDYFLPGSGRGGGALLAAAVLAVVFVAFGFLASRLDFCCPFAMEHSLFCEYRVGLGVEECKGRVLTANLERGDA